MTSAETSVKNSTQKNNNVATTNNMSATPTTHTKIIEEAANWALIHQYDQPSAAQQQNFQEWLNQSTAHKNAWHKAQTVFQTFDQIPNAISKNVLKKLDGGYDRRQALQLLSAILVAVPSGWLALRQVPWQTWTADLATTTGEVKSISLPDGSQITLNTNSAVDIVFNQHHRRIRLLSGEILIITATDPEGIAKPFLIDTHYGVVRALGTKFSVRLVNENTCHVAVFAHAVEISLLAGETKILQAGEQTHFSISNIMPVISVEPSVTLWQQGMFLVKDMRLIDVINELARYRTGVLRCDPAVENLRVSGSLSLTDTDSSLTLLEKNLPVRMSYISRYWVTVKLEG